LGDAPPRSPSREAAAYDERRSFGVSMGTDRGSAMTIALYGLVAFAIIFSGAISGLFLARLLPKHYRHDATRRVVQNQAMFPILLS
jgi:hypothetical protein